MKAAKRIRDYLHVLKRDQPNRSRISVLPGAEPLTVQDLEAVLDSRESWRQAARTQTEQMLRDLHTELWPDKPVHLHDFEHILTTIRNRRSLWTQFEQHRTDARTANHLLEQERAERERLASQLAAAENEVADLKAQLRQALHEITESEALLQRRPAFADVSVERERDEAQRKLAAAENVVRAQKVLLAEIQNAADQASNAHLPYGRQWTSVPEQIKALGDALSKARTDVDEARAKLSGGALHEQVRDLQRMLREQGDAAARAVQKRKQAEDDLHELRIKISQICAQHTGGYPDGNAYAQLNRIQAWLRETLAGTTAGQGVQAISEARVYQQRVHAGGDRRELLAAALALASGVSAIYPFGVTSWEGIRKYGGRRNQLAHAGACIAAILDLMQPQEKVHPVGPETLNNGDFTDWSNE